MNITKYIIFFANIFLLVFLLSNLTFAQENGAGEVLFSGECCINYNLTLVFSNGTVLHPGKGTMIFKNVSSIILSVMGENIRVNTTGDYVIRADSKSLVVGPLASNIILTKKMCEKAVNPGSFYLLISGIRLTNKSDIQEIVSDGETHVIPQKLIRYSLVNNTIFVPPGRCYSPPSILPKSGSKILVIVSEPRFQVVIFYWMKNHGGFEEKNTTVNERAMEKTSSLIETIPPYTTSREGRGPFRISEVQLVSLFFVVSGLVLLLLGYRSKSWLFS